MEKEAIKYYHDLLLEDNYLQTTQEILQKATETRHLAFGKRPVCSVLRPYFITEDNYNFVSRTSQLVSQGIFTLGQHLLTDEKLRKEVDLTEQEEIIINFDHKYGAADVSGRLDGFLSPEGDFNFVEYNAESPGGLAYGDELSETFAKMPIIEKLKEKYALKTFPIRKKIFGSLVSAYHRWGGEGLPNIAIIDWRGVSTYGEFLLCKEYFEAQGCKVKIADPDELEYKDGKLFIEDFQVNLIYKRVIIGEFLAKFALNHPLIEALKNQAVCMVNAFQVQMLYKKSCFALLSDPNYSYIYQKEVLEALLKHIPWTRKVRECKTLHQNNTIDLIPYIAENKDNLVLKPNGEYGGKGVVLGWQSTSDEWHDTLKGALESSYIVQERVPLGKEIYPSLIDGELRFDERFLDLDPYVWDGKNIEGCGIRLSKAALLNVTAGGGSATPMFIIDRK